MSVVSFSRFNIPKAVPFSYRGKLIILTHIRPENNYDIRTPQIFCVLVLYTRSKKMNHRGYIV